MKTKTQQKKSSSLFEDTPRLLAALALAALSAASAAFGSSQTWTNAPVDATWTNVNNWVGRAVPGGINLTGNTVNNDTATFNSPIPASGIGAVANPIVPDDATIAGARSRQIGSLVFDTADCGAYVFYSPSPAMTNSSTAPETGIFNVSHNGSIRLNAAVTNSQRILIPLNVRLPSSTDGIYNFVNNATSAAATLYIGAATNQGATSRGVTFVLDGSNLGANTAGALSEGTLGTGTSVRHGLTKQGTGTWILPGPNDFRSSSTINILGGTLIVKDPGAFSSVATPVVSNATLRIDGVTLTQNSFSLKNGGLIQMNGSGTINGVSVDGSLAGLSMGLATTSAADVLTVGDTMNKLTGGRSDTVLHVSGPGTVMLSQPANYAGAWSLDSGTNQLGDPAALGTGANVNMGAGATFDLTPLADLGYISYGLTTAGLSASGSGTTASTAATINAPNMTVDLASVVKNIGLTFRPTSFAGDSAHPALYIAQGTLSLSGNTFAVNNASGTPLGVGTYLLIQQASGIVNSGGGYAVVVTGSGLASGTVGSIQVLNGNVNLVVAPYVAKSLTWQGGSPNNPNAWDLATTANWLNGGSLSVFNNSDSVTFDATGATYPSVNLVGTLAPSSVTVNISSPTTYFFGGSGAIGGAAGLVKAGTGTLQVQNANSYLGSTMITNGTLQIGFPNALPTTTAVAVKSPGVLDMYANSDAIGALSGDGTVDNLAGGASVLDVGNDNANSTFSGVLQNTAGTFGLTKSGNGTLALTSSNSYSGPTTVNAGTLVLGNAYALGNGTSPLNTANGGVLDLNGHSIAVASLAGSGGTITNSGATGTNTLTVLSGGGVTYTGVIGENAGGAKDQLVLLGSTELRFNGNCTYSGGTIVGSGATLGIGYGTAGTGPFVLSNNATMYLHNQGGNSVFAGNPITIPEDNATVTFNSGQEGNGYSGLITGGATVTNSITGRISLSANNAMQYASFPGRVVIQPGAILRWGSGSTINNGGSNTTFEVNGTMHTRGNGTVSLAALVGNGYIDNPVNAAGTGIYLIGAKGEDSVYSGTFSGTNSLVKVGPARLTLDGAVVTTNTDYVTYTNYLYAPAVSHFGNTTVSNGVLTLVVPNSLSNSPAITLAGTSAVLDATLMGYIQDQIDPSSLTVTNQLLVTNGVFELYASQTLAGVGALQGSLRADSGSIVSPGNAIGRLTISGAAVLGGLVRMELNRTNASGTNDLLAAASFAVTGDLVVTNAGPDLVNGDSFKLFNMPVSGFAAVSLPVATSGGSTYLWNNKLAVDGTIQLVSGGVPPVNTTPTNITAVVSGSTLTLSWPSDHTGWRLLIQTNNLASGISTNALDWGTAAGSAATNQVSITIDPARPTEFYRLVYP